MGNFVWHCSFLRTGHLFWLIAGVLLWTACTPRAHKKEVIPSTYYQEPHRPQFHFSPERNWMNDPNGLVYYKGEYHLFYQHYPDSNVWGPMHWGHAVSRDLVHWEHLPIALFPDANGCIFSGSIVIDAQNTSGFAPANSTEQPLVAIFTYHNLEWERAGRLDRESQGIAYSLDRGRTWVKYAGNPVLPNKGDVDFRDPKVFWHSATRRWIMPLAVGQHLEIFTSPDLKNWTKASDFGETEGAHGGVWECPDLFPITSNDGVEKWVLLQNIGRGAVNGGSGTQYFVGTFDGKTFKNDNPPATTLWLDYGADNYAGVTWFNAPDERRILIGWMSNWDDYAQTVPTEKWRSAMTVPRVLRLEKTIAGYRIFQAPVENLKKLRRNQVSIPAQAFSNTLTVDQKSVLKELELHVDLSATTAKQLGFRLKNSLGEFVEAGYDVTGQTFYIDRTRSGKTNFSKTFSQKHVAPLVAGGKLHLNVLVDAASIEIFVAGHPVAITEIFFPNEDFTTLELFGKGGVVQVLPSSVWELQSIWK
jgi:fructan beta-fructosidase